MSFFSYKLQSDIRQDQTFHLTKQTFQGAFTSLPHCHETAELIYIADGKGVLTFNNKKLYLDSGSLTLVNSNVMHSERGEENISTTLYWANASQFMVDFEDDFIEINPKSLQIDCKTLFTALENELAKQEEYWQSQANSLFQILFVNIKRLIGFSSEADSPIKHSKLYPAVRYIHENFYREIDIKTLSDTVYLSKSQFTRLFKKEYAMTPHQYTLQKRVEAAKFLLLTHDYSLAYIAERLSFSDVSCFIRTFKSITGTTPKQFRASHA